jgi:uncharacterized protein (DUF2384 family)
MNLQQGTAGREIAAERVDRLAEWLEVSLGARLAAFAAGISQRDMHRIVHGQERPDEEIERRLRNLFAVASLLAVRDGAGFAYSWLTEPNPGLDNRTPASLLHEGEAPESVWFAAAPAF